VAAPNSQDVIAAQMKVIQIARIKKSCRRCERIAQEPAHSRQSPGCIAGPNMLADAARQKLNLPNVMALFAWFEQQLPLA